MNNHNNNCPTKNEEVVNADAWGDLECLYKACQTTTTDGGLYTDRGVSERGENE